MPHVRRPGDTKNFRNYPLHPCLFFHPDPPSAQFFPASMPFHQKSCAKKIAGAAKAAGLPNPLLKSQSARAVPGMKQCPTIPRRPGSAAGGSATGESLPPVDFSTMNTGALRSFLDKRGVSHAGCLEKACSI